VTKPVEVGKVGPLQIAGYFDWPKLYKDVTGWGSNELCQVWEEFYKDKVSPIGKDIEIKWVFVRKVDRMHKYEMITFMKIWDCRPVEVTKDGTTKTLWYGRMQVYLTAKIDRDFQGLFDTPMMSKLWGIYDAVTSMEHFGFNHWDHWYYKMYELQAVIKDNFGVDTK
jgi:hypothetical protein